MLDKKSIEYRKITLFNRLKKCNPFYGVKNYNVNPVGKINMEITMIQGQPKILSLYFYSYIFLYILFLIFQHTPLLFFGRI